MAFTKALYYPWIDIKNEAWLKNAMLYWEQIQTIVPASIEQPYNTSTSRDFSNEGLLVPLRVNSDMREIREMRGYVLRYLRSPKVGEALMAAEMPEYNYIHSYKLPEGVRHLIEIHMDKLPYVAHRGFGRFRGNNPNVQKDGFTEVDLLFADYYMTILATRLSNSLGAGLLTDRGLLERLAISTWFDNGLLNVESAGLTAYRFGKSAHRPDAQLSLAQGILASLVLEGIQIDPETPVKKILEFRKNHAAELGRFRQKVGELTNTIPGDQPIEVLRQHVKDIYLNDVRPAIKDLGKGLKDSQIKWAAKSLLSVSCMTSIPLVVQGLSKPYALLAYAGISLTISSIFYNLDRGNLLRQNPFSYVLAAEKEFKQTNASR